MIRDYHPGRYDDATTLDVYGPPDPPPVFHRTPIPPPCRSCLKRYGHWDDCTMPALSTVS